VGIVGPALLPGGWVERNHPIEGGAEVERAIDHDGRGFERYAVVMGAVGDVAGVVDPSDIKLADIGAIHLIERRET
jgi:hypothetical protein